MGVGALDVVRGAGPVFGALLIGIAVGMFAIGMQLNTECISVAGEAVGPVCRTLAWGDRWAQWSALGGAALFVAAFGAEAAIDRGWSV
jgi:hypothetical protein